MRVRRYDLEVRHHRATLLERCGRRQGCRKRKMGSARRAAAAAGLMSDFSPSQLAGKLAQGVTDRTTVREVAEQVERAFEEHGDDWIPEFVGEVRRLRIWELEPAHTLFARLALDFGPWFSLGYREPGPIVRLKRQLLSLILEHAQLLPTLMSLRDEWHLLPAIFECAQAPNDEATIWAAAKLIWEAARADMAGGLMSAAFGDWVCSDAERVAQVKGLVLTWANEPSEPWQAVEALVDGVVRNSAESASWTFDLTEVLGRHRSGPGFGLRVSILRHDTPNGVPLEEALNAVVSDWPGEGLLLAIRTVRRLPGRAMTARWNIVAGLLRRFLPLLPSPARDSVIESAGSFLWLTTLNSREREGYFEGPLPHESISEASAGTFDSFLSAFLGADPEGDRPLCIGLCLLKSWVRLHVSEAVEARGLADLLPQTFRVLRETNPQLLALWPLRLAVDEEPHIRSAGVALLSPEFVDSRALRWLRPFEKFAVALETASANVYWDRIISFLLLLAVEDRNVTGRVLEILLSYHCRNVPSATQSAVDSFFGNVRSSDALTDDEQSELAELLTVATTKEFLRREQRADVVELRATNYVEDVWLVYHHRKNIQLRNSPSGSVVEQIFTTVPVLRGGQHRHWMKLGEQWKLDGPRGFAEYRSSVELPMESFVDDLAERERRIHWRELAHRLLNEPEAW